MAENTTVTIADDDDQILTETPTVLVCEGDGGIEMGKAVLELAEREGVRKRIKMIAINAGSEDSHELGDTVETVTLKTPKRRFHDHDKHDRHYLTEDATLGGGDGSIRQPGIGRYHFDNPERVGSYEDQIRRTIKQFVTHFENDPDVSGPSAVNVFQMVGAGGGTGSGIAPLITGLLHEVIKDLDEEVSPGFEHWTVCSIASATNFNGGGDVPDIDWRYIANSLAFLDELRAITNYDGDTDYPLRIPLLASRDQTSTRRTAYTITENPFSGVFLLRYDEDRSDDDQYRDGVDRTAARVIIEWMRKDQPQFDDIENEANVLEHTFYEARGLDFEVPTEQIETLFEKKTTYQNHADTVESLTDEIEAYDAALAQLDAAIDADDVLRGDGDPVPATEASDDEDDIPVPAAMATEFERAQQIAGNIDPQYTRLDSIKAELGEHQDRRTHSFHDRVDGDQIQRAVFMAAMHAEATTALRNHRFSSLVDTFVEKHDEEIKRYDPAFDATDSPKTQFVQTIEPMLESQVQSLSNELDDFGLRARLTGSEEYTNVKERLERKRRHLQQLRDARDEHDRLAGLAEDIKSERDDAIASLEARHTTLTDARETASSNRTTARQKRDTAKNQLDRYIEDVRKAPLGRFITLPITSGVELSDDRLSGESGITSLIDSGVMQTDRIVDLLKQTLDTHEDGALGATLETRNEVRRPSRSRPVVFCTQEVRERIWQNDANGTAPKTVATDEFNKQPQTVVCTDDQRIGLLAYHGDLALDNFDHGDLRDSLERGRPTLWGTPIPLEDSYAYPELLPDHHPVSMRSQIEDTALPEWGEGDD
ncbi:tubulin-like doman-containing protein [Halarchaeum sp. P4]|uniref:tubulin-like doman-containing protein n=1 Tax=Halarchaeum sp. P4 TaxID=3421639 RepID=UPI003EBCF6DD